MKIAIIPSNNGLGHIRRCSIIANNNSFFSSKKFSTLLKKITNKNTKIYDCWEILDNKFKKYFHYKTIGEI